MFNYIINVHNSADHLDTVLNAVFDVKTSQSRVYVVLDGCTDGSEAIVNGYNAEKIFTPDVRETAAISWALQQTPQNGRINFILQDDVVLNDPMTEWVIMEAYKKFPNIGVLGMRHGANFEPDVLINKKHASETDLIQNECQPHMPNIPLLKEGYITERQIIYKSPICISGEVVQRLGGYDKRFEPIAHDDTEYCIRAFKSGYKNYVLGLDVSQPIHWGGTRRFPDVHKDNEKMHEDHMNLIRKLYKNELEYLGKNHPPLTETKL